MTITGQSTDHSAALWLRRYHPAADRDVRLVCFPHAGGSASFFHPVSATFSARADVIALQYPGRQDRRREPCLTDLGTLADRVTEQLLTLDDKPTVFFGHSMGAVLAFETAWRLEQKGVDAPRAVIASGRRAPSSTRPETVHQRDDDGIIAELRLLNGTDPGVLGDDEILRMALPAIRGDYRAIETYHCEPEDRAVQCPVTVLTGADDPRTTLDEAAAWERHTRGAFRLEVFPGGHFFLAGQQAAVNAEISRELEKAGNS
ncbi:alpha/beta fold hydrolase [Streptomyces sp. SCA3-4]|uniref:thioesterase II family protein n=1 Tax=Streptomyces sichuanensis TaxID=2871810 RepID=UPI001CE2C853|nr:alpha/beta fold hydrolase [Streptomyces sichuanensis]MCA6092892.1 alpha/beta fold hydrolase [Streptomyces sichuanensis]